MFASDDPLHAEWLFGGWVSEVRCNYLYVELKVNGSYGEACGLGFDVPTSEIQVLIRWRSAWNIDIYYEGREVMHKTASFALELPDICVAGGESMCEENKMDSEFRYLEYIMDNDGVGPPAPWRDYCSVLVHDPYKLNLIEAYDHFTVSGGKDVVVRPSPLGGAKPQGSNAPCESIK